MWIRIGGGKALERRKDGSRILGGETTEWLWLINEVCPKNRVSLYSVAAGSLHQAREELELKGEGEKTETVPWGPSSMPAYLVCWWIHYLKPLESRPHYLKNKTIKCGRRNMLPVVPAEVSPFQFLIRSLLSFLRCLSSPLFEACLSLLSLHLLLLSRCHSSSFSRLERTRVLWQMVGRRAGF